MKSYRLIKDWPVSWNKDWIIPKGTEFVFRSPVYFHKQSSTYFDEFFVENSKEWFEPVEATVSEVTLKNIE